MEVVRHLALVDDPGPFLLRGARPQVVEEGGKITEGERVDDFCFDVLRGSFRGAAGWDVWKRGNLSRVEKVV